MRNIGLDLKIAGHSKRNFANEARATPAQGWRGRLLSSISKRCICCGLCLAIQLMGLHSGRAQPPVELARLPSLPTAGSTILESPAVEQPAAEPNVGADRPAPALVGLPTTYSIRPQPLTAQSQGELNASQAAASDASASQWLQATPPGGVLSEAPPFFFTQEELPSPEASPGQKVVPPAATEVIEVAPVFDNLIASAPMRGRRRFNPSEPGLGVERLAFSLFDIEPAQPFNNLRVRTVLGQRMHLPDRAEYFWGRTVDRRGPPGGETVLNYQDLRLRMETGAKKFSLAFEVPFRAVDPVENANHAGLGDLQLSTKTVLLEGKSWMFTQYFGTHMPTGSPSMGLGTGHVSLEPGFLFRNKWRDDSWLHGELKFWFPLGADPMHGGQVVKFATGMNRVWYETDTSAWLPSLELTSYTVLNGLARDATGSIHAIDGDFNFYLTPGVRYAVDGRGDLGLFEIGSALSLATTRDRFTDSTFTFDLRWSW